MSEDEKVDRPVRWRPAELRWGLANPGVHGLGDVLLNRIPAVTPGDADDERETYIITATEDEISDAVVAVNDWISDRPQWATMDAHGFQAALAFPPRTPD